MIKKVYLPALAWLLVITVLSVMPGLPAPHFDLLSSDKIGHAGAYAILTWLIFRGFKSANGGPAGGNQSLMIFAFSTGYGILMEFVQATFFPYRHFEIDDMIANASGALIVSWIMFSRSDASSGNI